ncbi:MAG: peptidase S15 [Mycobacterium sp.]|nr:peptidase S15 [Mycobacterium sp.]
MNAARYIGRVGGLAVALGVGTALLTGYGVASAESDSGGSASSSVSAGTADSSSSAGSGREVSAADDAAGGAGADDESAAPGDDSGIADDLGDNGDIADDLSDNGDIADDLSDDSDIADDLSVDSDIAGEISDDSEFAELVGESAPSGSGGPSSFSSSSSDVAGAVPELDEVSEVSEFDFEDDAELSMSSQGADPSLNGQSVVTVHEVTSVPQIASAVEAAPASSSVVSLASASLDPLVGDEPTVPAGTPFEWMLAAAARRDISSEPTATQSVTSADASSSAVASAGLFSNPISVTPIPTVLNDGILLGIIEAFSSRGFELTYTVKEAPSDGGKITLVNSTECAQITSCGDAFPGAPADSGDYTLLPDLSTVQSGGTTQFSVLISEVTDFDKFMEGLLGPTLGPLLVPPVVRFLQQVPIVGTLLAPLIGYSVVETISVDVGELVAPGAPVAFTTDVISFDGTPISTNYFPVSGLAAGDPPAPTLLNGPGLGSAGTINPFARDVPEGAPAVALPGINLVRTEGYNYVSWDPRGEHGSGGVLQLDNPFFEGRDVQAIMDFLVVNDLTATSGTTPSGAPDPLIGMFGGSYGGGIQLVVAGIDQRVDAIAPGIAWNSLNEAIYPDDAFKTAWANLLYLDLVTAGADINSQIPPAIFTGNLFNFVSESAEAVLTSAGPTVLVESITAPSLLIQGIQDGLFVLEQSVQNGEILDANGILTKMIWFCGGHGLCLDPLNPTQNDVVVGTTMAWMDQHVKGEMIAEPPNFQWFGQLGGHFVSDLYPFEDGFTGPSLDVSDDGGYLPLFSLIGGSGPSREVPLLISQATASKAWNALNVSITTPAEETLIVGAPELTFTYSGFGNAEYVYGQIIDVDTGLVLGNLVKPIPVTLDGRTHSVTWDLENIVYTAASENELLLQITSSATVYEDWSAWGGINISDLELKLPTVAPGVATRVLG